MVDTRISALGMWRYSNDFLVAAEKTQPVPKSAKDIYALKYNGVAYYLLGHSIELSLKAFLLCRGMSISTLRYKPYAHSLANLRKEASTRKLGREVKLTERQKAIIDYFSDSYMKKRHEYFERGIMSVPQYHELHQTTSALVTGLFRICNRHTLAV